MSQYTTIISKAKIEDVRLISVSSLSGDPTHTYTHAGVKNITHALVIVTDGEGVLTIGEVTYPLTKNTLFLIPAESDVTFSSNKEKPYSFFSITFECSRLNELITLNESNPLISLKEAKTERRFRAIFKCLENQTNRSFCRSLSYFFAILSSLAFSAQIADTKKNKDAVRDAIEYINSNYMNDKLTITGIAEKLYLNRSYFSELFKKETGMTAIDYINDVRLKKGTKLLTDTDMSISQISDAVGMNYVWFSKLFKSRNGMSPAKYRATIKFLR